MNTNFCHCGPRLQQSQQGVTAVWQSFLQTHCQGCHFKHQLLRGPIMKLAFVPYPCCTASTQTIACQDSHPKQTPSMPRWCSVQPNLLDTEQFNVDQCQLQSLHCKSAVLHWLCCIQGAHYVAASQQSKVHGGKVLREYTEAIDWLLCRSWYI